MVRSLAKVTGVAIPVTALATVALNGAACDRSETGVEVLGGAGGETSSGGGGAGGSGAGGAATDGGK